MLIFRDFHHFSHDVMTSVNVSNTIRIYVRCDLTTSVSGMAINLSMVVDNQMLCRNVE